MREKILSLLGSNLEPTVVAAAVGCTPGYVSQLLQEEDFKSKVIELRLVNMQQEKNIDDIWDNVEERLLKKFEGLIDYYVKPKDVLDALTKINAAKRKTKLSGGNNTLTAVGTVVKLSMPAITINKYTVNMNGGMIEVDGRKLKAMDSKTLLRTLEERRSNGQEPALLDAPPQQSTPREKTISVDSI